MIQCPNCGGAIKFNIESQSMKCDSCQSMFNPYDFDYGVSAEEETEYDVTVYKCRNCGGEIIATDETAAGFCSYCGASNVLEGRIAREKRPQLIIPFKQTKAQCIERFKNRMSKALFAPGEYKNAGRVDSFRGIYMPYWLFDMSQNGGINVRTSRSHRSGDYIITDHYDMKGIIDNQYNGVSYDASSTFADDISSEIAPFNVQDITTFSPSFLSGYYADIADVSSEVYEDTAVELASESTYNYLRKKSPMSSHHFDDTKESVKNKIHTRVDNRRSAMFPVWFMSYRNKDRVAYATVNGQTGRMSADIPVSMPKYFVCVLIIAAVLFAIFQMFFTVTPDVLILLTAIVACISVILYNSEMKKILAKENYEDDLGMQDRMRRKKEAREQAQKGASFNAQGNEGNYAVTDNDIRRGSKPKKKSAGFAKNMSFSSIILIIIIIFAFGGNVIMGLLAGVAGSLGLTRIMSILSVVTLILSFCMTISSSRKIKKMKGKKGLPATIWTVIGILAITIISIWDPANDAIYYGAAIFSMIGVALTVVDLMASYNYIAMRPLPQFEIYHGGDDRA